MRFEYPAKILLAWGEAISGNTKIRDWLIQNGYRELGLFVFALHNKQDARDWLMENGYPHLMAVINGAEGKKEAVDWLMKYQLDVLAHVALGGDGDEKAHQWLVKNNFREFAIIAKRIQIVKDQIDNDNYDVHKISKD